MAIELADMPSVIAHGQGYFISGTVTGIPNESIIKIEVYNDYMKFGFLEEVEEEFELRVEDGVFYMNPLGNPQYFYGPGVYTVVASYLPPVGVAVSDHKYGTVGDP